MNCYIDKFDLYRKLCERDMWLGSRYDKTKPKSIERKIIQAQINEIDFFKRLFFYEPAVKVKDIVYGEWVWREKWDIHPETHSCELVSCGWYCSECGIELVEYLTKTTGEQVYLDDDHDKPKLKYCPHCGANMRKENNNESNY